MIIAIIAGLIVLGLLICFGLAWYVHRRVFGKRWDPDGVVRYYTLEEYPGLCADAFSVSYHQDTLKGYLYHYPDAKPDRIVVFAHGMWGSHQAYFQEIAYLCQEGFIVLGFDNKGTSLSSGKSIGGLGQGPACLDAVLDAVEKKYPKASIEVFGHSWGGFAALTIAHYHPHLTKIVAMAPFVSLRRVLCGLLSRKLWFLIPFLILVDAIYCGKYSFCNGASILKKSSIPTFILHSIDDSMVQYARNTGYLVRTVDSANLTICRLQGKNHNPDYTKEAILYTAGAMAELKRLPKERQKEYYAQLNFHKMGELDEEVMQKIVQFLQS